MKQTPEVLATALVHHGRVFDFTKERVTLTNGVTVDMEVIRHPGAAAIVPLTADGQVIMLKQYRHAVGSSLWEIPAGTMDPGDASPLDCARRELVEETGFSAATWDDLGALTPVPGYSDERIHLFLARDLAPPPRTWMPTRSSPFTPCPSPRCDVWFSRARSPMPRPSPGFS